MKKILFLIIFASISVHSQTYNSLYLLKYEILQLDSLENVYRYAPFKIYVDFKQIEPYISENYKTHINKKNQNVVTSKCKLPLIRTA